MGIQEQQQGGTTDEAEPFMGSGRFGNEYNNSCFSALHLHFVFGCVSFSLITNRNSVSMAARAYLLGYNCADEKELEAALRFC